MEDYKSILSSAYQPLYVTVLLICPIVSVQVFRRIQSNIGRKSENGAFRRIILIYQVYIVDDMLWVIF